MTKNEKGLLAIGIVAVAGFLAYKFLYRSKSQQIRYLVANNYSQGTPASLMSLGDDFIAAWYNGARRGDTSFTLNGKSYNTGGGKAIV